MQGTTVKIKPHLYNGLSNTLYFTSTVSKLAYGEHILLDNLSYYVFDTSSILSNKRYTVWKKPPYKSANISFSDILKSRYKIDKFSSAPNPDTVRSSLWKPFALLSITNKSKTHSLQRYKSFLSSVFFCGYFAVLQRRFYRDRPFVFSPRFAEHRLSVWTVTKELIINITEIIFNVFSSISFLHFPHLAHPLL